MQALIVFAAVIATAAAGGITGYSTGNYVQHAHVAHAVAPAVAPVAYGLGGPVLAAAPVAKAIAPVAQSTQFVNRAPAARIAVAAAPVAYAAGPIAHPVGLAAGPIAYGGPALAGPILG